MIIFIIIMLAIQNMIIYRETFSSIEIFINSSGFTGVYLVSLVYYLVRLLTFIIINVNGSMFLQRHRKFIKPFLSLKVSI